MFDVPHDRLGARLHQQVFGDLPTATARALDTPDVAGAVRPLLASGWRPAQLAARVGALPASEDPVPAVLALLQRLCERDSPSSAWQRERAERERQQAARDEDRHAAASEASRAAWVAEARRSLGLPSRPARAPVSRPSPSCAGCGGPGEFFVTRQVRLCTVCVAALASGTAHLGSGARVG